jgi:hypothetical protein
MFVVALMFVVAGCGGNTETYGRPTGSSNMAAVIVVTIPTAASTQPKPAHSSMISSRRLIPLLISAESASTRSAPRGITASSSPATSAPAELSRAFYLEHVEEHEHDRDGRVAMQDPSGEPVERRQPVVAEGDQLAVEDALDRQRAELGEQLGHLPAAPAADAVFVAAADDRAEAIPLRLERPAARESGAVQASPALGPEASQQQATIALFSHTGSCFDSSTRASGERRSVMAPRAPSR